MKNWQFALNQQYREQSGVALDTGSMKLMSETSEYWLVNYNEGQAEFINLVYKDNRPMQTLEV